MTSVHRSLTALLAVAALTMVIAAPAQAHRGRVFGPSFGGPGAGAGELSLTSVTGVATEKTTGVLTFGGSGLAVSGATHDVYVADTGNHRVDEFTSSGAFVRAWGWGVENGASESQVCTEATGCQAGIPGASSGQFETPMFIAVDDSPGGEGDIYVAEYAEYSSPGVIVQKFSPTGSLIESWGAKGRVGTGALPEPEEFGQIRGIAVASSGELAVGTGLGIFEFDQSTGSYIGRVGSESLGGGGVPILAEPDGIGVDSSGNFYFESAMHASEIDKFNSNDVEIGLFKMLGTPPPGWSIFSATGLAVSQAGELYVDEGDAIQVISPSCVSLCAPTTTFSSPQLTNGAGLAVDSQHETVYIAETAADKIERIIPEPPSSPLVQAGSQSVSNVSADSATLEAEVSPRSEAGEELTSYRFQYTPEESFQREGFAGAGSLPVPDGRLTPSFEDDFVTAHPQGLLAGTTYRFRLVAENGISRKEGKPAEGERNGAGEEVVRTFTTQSSGVFALPDDRAWELVSPPDKRSALIKDLENNGLMQASADGDAITYLATAPTEAQPAGNGNSTQVLSTRGEGDAASWGSLDISTPHDTPVGLDLTAFGADYRFFSTDLSAGVVQFFDAFIPPLSPEASEQTPYLRTDYSAGDAADPCLSSCYRPLVTGAPGFANVPEGAEFGEHTPSCEQLCGPKFLGASPDGSHIVLTAKVALTEGAPAESLYEWAGGALQLVSVLPEGQPAPTSGDPQLGVEGQGEGLKGQAISADGSRILWSTGREASLHLYDRDVAGEETVELGGAGARFQTASSDGSRVFFTEGGDLYLFEAPLGGALSAGHVTDLAPGAEVLDEVSGASEDGSSIYFVGNGVLTTKPNARGESAVPGECGGQAQASRALCNLYAWHDGVTRLVSVLSGDDAPDWGGRASRGLLVTARVSPNGSWFAFMSERSLTGYDNRDLASGQPDEEVFLYDTSSDSGEGRLVCASCNLTGSRPHGIFDIGGTGPETRRVDEQRVWAGHWLAANVPSWASALYQSRYLSDSGRLLFNSSDALVPSDTNGVEDVYEFEQPGIGDCSQAGATFSSGSGGCVDLISSGTSKEESAFIDASESGDDVFFLTSAQLSSRDTDAVRDVYDARVDGGFPQAQSPPACEGDACQSPVAAPNDPTPGSLTYQGPGNPTPLLTVKKVAKKKPPKCSKGKHLSHGKCVKTKSKRRAGKAGRSSNKRRAKS
ncbi:MAG: hypothetical protein WAN93_00600 [Solirubrobacteraceae bacterium]